MFKTSTMVSKSKWKLKTLALSVMLATMIAATGTPAFAADVSLTTTDVLQAMSKTGTLDDSAANVTNTGSSIVATDQSGLAVVVPTVAEPTVRLDAPGVASDVAVTIDTDPGASAKVVDGDLTVITGAEKGTTSVIQPLDGGVRQLAVMDSTSDFSQTYKLDIPAEAGIYAFSDGSYSIAVFNGGDASDPQNYREIQHIAAPWAVDAQGKPVATAYSFVGGNLVQTTSPSPDTQFPVTADPCFDILSKNGCAGQVTNAAVGGIVGGAVGALAAPPMIPVTAALGAAGAMLACMITCSPTAPPVKVNITVSGNTVQVQAPPSVIVKVTTVPPAKPKK